MNRRELMGAGLTAAGISLLPGAAGAASPSPSGGFPKDFLWGTSTSGYQVEGNSTASDIWLLEHVEPSIYATTSGDACDFLHRWESDLDLVKQLGLGAFRFSFEWSRIEPEPGEFSTAFLDHYRRIVDGCLERGIVPVTTFNHFAAPRWFSAQNGWLNADAPALFGRYCDKVAAHMADRLRIAVTINEPEIEHLLKWADLPPGFQDAKRAMRASAAKACGTDRFAAFTSILPAELDAFRDGLIAGHKAARSAIRSHSPSVKVGVSLALSDDQATLDTGLRDRKRREVYEPWFAASEGDDFIAIQNYDRTVFGPTGILPAPANAPRNQTGGEIYPGSLAGAVRYAHASTNLPVLITEHGVATTDDAVRAAFIVDSLKLLQPVVASGVPVLGYMHWSFLEGFEWIFGYGPNFGLVDVDRQTQVRSPKPSARLLGTIARTNRV